MKRYKLTLSNVDETDTLVIVELANKFFIETYEAHDSYQFFVDNGDTLIKDEDNELFYYPMHYYGENIEEAFGLENCVYLGWDYATIKIEELD
jgi:hypothetical protein